MSGRPTNTRAVRLAALVVGWLLVAATAAAQVPESPLPDEADETAELAALEAEAQLRGCDPLDASNCLLPFPSDHFTKPVPPDAIGGTARGGTGRRVDLDRRAMPRNIAGNPVDPTEWNRNDGFSPAQMLLTHVPDVAVAKDADGDPTGPVVGAPSIDDVGSYTAPDAAAVVIDAETGERHPIWAEVDLNAGQLYPPGGEEKPGEARRALMIRPAVNFEEGHRYVVALRNLRSASGGPVEAPAFFEACRDGEGLPTPALAERCEALRDGAFPVLQEGGIELDEDLYLAWDFTVASTQNNVSRLKHMRDDAFTSLGQQETADGEVTDLGEAPSFQVNDVRTGTDEGKRYEEIHGTMEVPSYVVPPDPSPLERADGTRAVLDAMSAVNEDLAEVADIASSVSAPPNRLHYDPTDELHPDDPEMQPFGDGLPDRTGTMTVPWMCRLYEDATAESPARAGIYGHGLLDRRRAITYDAVPELSTFDPEHNFLFCAADWFGFAAGDLANVVAATFDLSLFRVIPDATQQGMLNFLFLARLLRHPDGFASHEAFQADDEQPRFENDEVFYHGISQGGILGGAVLAMSKDISRGTLGVPGASYSLLLRRSTGYSGDAVDGVPVSFSQVTYTAYPDDLDRTLLLSMIQMLWDRGENNGYAAHIADNSALEGPDNQVMLRPVFADHQVTHWAAYDMARTILRSADGEDFLADLYPRDCSAGVTFCYDTREDFHLERNVDTEFLWGMPVSDVEAFPAGREKVAYDDPTDGKRSPLSGLIQWDEGRTAAPPLGNIPANWKDDHDPHGFARDAAGALCQQSHFLWAGGGLIDVRNVRTGEPCPALPTPEGGPPEWVPGPPENPGPPGQG